MTSQGKVPGRFKDFWLINEGTFADAMFTLFKPFMTKKMLDRVRGTGHAVAVTRGCGRVGSNEVTP